MENASKALIIAGAILLSILIISLGIVVVNNVQGTINNTNLNSQEAQTFNNKFSSYLGLNKSNAEMNALVQTIQAENGAQSKLAEPHYIKLTVTGLTGYFTGDATIDVTAAGATSFQYPSFSAGKTYKASSKAGTNGYINEITIE